MLVILALRRQRQEDHEFEANLVFIVRSCFKKLRAGDAAQC
jgi:hypothetical protein